MPGWVKFWLIVAGILLFAYAFNISIPGFISGLIHGLQTMHNSNAGH